MVEKIAKEALEEIYASFKPLIREYNPRAQLRLIKRALQVANDAHVGQKRDSGEPYVTHPIEVMKILIGMKADSATLCAGLLHDVVEDTPVTQKQLEKEFGDEVAQLVDGVTKIEKIHFDSKEDYTAENIRKVLLATTKDIRVILIKLADRLHNMRTLKGVGLEKQRRIARETLHIYAPIAHKLGIFWIKGELEDLCLRYLNPEIYQLLAKSISEKRSKREKVTRQIIKEVENHLEAKKIKTHVFGRAKYFFSIYKKMQKKKLDFDQVYDLIAIRIITKTIPDCYAALGVIHDLWKPQPKRFKDYISVPKSNGYQSLHTTVMSTYGKLVEVQIRTDKMHNESEYGIAAHWRYHGSARDKAFDKRIGLLKQLLEWKMQADDAKDFVETLKIDLFQDEIVVFTPKGDPITLRVKSTPVDFAYMVHSNVGDHCTQAKVNGKVVPLDYALRSGDVIDIMTRKNAKPSRQWLKFVRTSKAKSKIRQTLHIASEDDPKKGKKKHTEDLSEATLLRFIRINAKKGHPKLSKCCQPHRGDKIRGFFTKDKKITIHRIECPNVYTLSPEKEVPVSWMQTERLNMATCVILVEDRVGMLADIMNAIATQKLNITSVHSKNKRDRVLIKVKIRIDDEEQIKPLKAALKKVKGIIDLKVNE
jgi:GTP diphosphokinase / guanosine-3',5'-bis(diphosphate) 3'-diphosphatase